MYYLSTPYTHPDPAVEQSRFERACQIAGHLMQNCGLIVFSPIVHGHPIAERCGLPTDFEYWRRYNRDLISHAQRLLVVMMPGWETSAGVQGEIALAQEMNVPLEYLEDSLPPELSAGVRAHVSLDAWREQL